MSCCRCANSARVVSMFCCVWRICYIGVCVRGYALDDGDLVAEVKCLGLQLLLLPLLFADLPLQGLRLFTKLDILSFQRGLLFTLLTNLLGYRGELFLFRSNLVGNCVSARISLLRCEHSCSTAWKD